MYDVILRVSGGLLAVLLLLAGISKLRRPSLTARTLVGLMPSRLHPGASLSSVARLATRSLGALEVALGVAILALRLRPTLPVSASLTALYGGFVVVTAAARRAQLPCGCGTRHGALPAGTADVMRSCILATLAAVLTCSRLAPATATTYRAVTGVALALLVAWVLLSITAAWPARAPDENETATPSAGQPIEVAHSESTPTRRAVLSGALGIGLAGLVVSPFVSPAVAAAGRNTRRSRPRPFIDREKTDKLLGVASADDSFQRLTNLIVSRGGSISPKQSFGMRFEIPRGGVRHDAVALLTPFALAGQRRLLCWIPGPAASGGSAEAGMPSGEVLRAAPNAPIKNIGPGMREVTPALYAVAMGTYPEQFAPSFGCACPSEECFTCCDTNVVVQAQCQTGVTEAELCCINCQFDPQYGSCCSFCYLRALIICYGCYLLCSQCSY
jgi:hypothetical protein